MAEYHVGCGAFAIYAGTLNAKKTKIYGKTKQSVPMKQSTLFVIIW